MRLSSEDERKLKEFYSSSNEAHRVNSRRVQWTETAGQVTRFRVLSTIGDLRGKSVLDVGSGLGDFYVYLRDYVGGMRYTGIDILPEFVREARASYPHVEFLCEDFMAFDPERKFDYVLASGALTFKVENNEEFYFDFIRKMYAHAKIGAGFNMLDRRFHPDDETYAAYNPKKVVAYAETFAKRADIQTNYSEQDFTVFLYK